MKKKNSTGTLLAQWVKNPPAMQETREDAGQMPGSGRFPGGGKGPPPPVPCLEDPMGRA